MKYQAVHKRNSEHTVALFENNALICKNEE